LSGGADGLFQGETHGIVGNWIHVADDLGGQPAVIFEACRNVVEVVLGFDDMASSLPAL